jgi:hypothetical protein
MLRGYTGCCISFKALFEKDAGPGVVSNMTLGVAIGNGGKAQE